MVICLEQGADLHMAQQIPLPLTVSCFSKIQIGFTFLVPAHPSSPGQRAVKLMCVCVFERVRNKKWKGIGADLIQHPVIFLKLLAYSSLKYLDIFAMVGPVRAPGIMCP